MWVLWYPGIGEGSSGGGLLADSYLLLASVAAGDWRLRHNGGIPDGVMEMDDTRKESFKLQGGQLLDKVKQLIHEGNVRKVTVKQGERVLAEFPLTLGVAAAVIAPVLAAVGAIAALVTECTIEVERTDKAPPKEEPAEDTG